MPNAPWRFFSSENIEGRRDRELYAEVSLLACCRLFADGVAGRAGFLAVRRNDQCPALSRFAPRDPFSPYATQVN